MKVRVVNLLGADVHEASFIDYPDELSDSGGTKRVLQVRPGDKPPMHMESYSADELEVVQASPEEEKELADLGYHDVQRPA